MTASDVALLAAAGVAGALIGTAGGITSLVTYPTLLFVGVAPLAANVVNLVAVVACWPASALTSQPELRGQGAWLRRWLPLCAVLVAAGAVLLLVTPQNVFVRVVPFLVLLGGLALLLQPGLLARRRTIHNEGGRVGLATGLGVISLYNGYFGAGSGVMTLALLLLSLRVSLPVANALKNMLVGSAALVTAVIFGVAAHVMWNAVLPLAAGEFVGGLAGPVVTRHLRSDVIRWIAALLAMALAAALWIDPRL